MSVETVARKRKRGQDGRYVDRRGRAKHWQARVTRVPDRWKSQPKSDLATAVLFIRDQLRLYASTIGIALAEEPEKLCAQAMRKRQADRVEFRCSVLRELMMDAALARAPITAADYPALAERMAQRCGEPFHVSTLYRLPYKAIIEDRDARDTAEDRQHRALVRLSRGELLCILDGDLRQIDALKAQIWEALDQMPALGNDEAPPTRRLFEWQ